MIKAFFKTILYKPLYNALMFLVWLIPGHSVGWAIIILTIIIRLLLLPSSAKSIKIQKKMRQLQPELDKIKEKYKDDKQAQAQAMMQFYSQNKVNPLGGCLPILIQFPVLIILYYVFTVGLDTSRFDLLYGFTPRPEFVNAMFWGINLSKPSLYLAIVAGIFQFIQAKQLMPKARPAHKKTVKKGDNFSDLQNILSGQMTYMMPIFTVVIAMKLPAALPLYWIITTIFAVIQQWLILKSKNEGVSVKIREGSF